MMMMMTTMLRQAMRHRACVPVTCVPQSLVGRFMSTRLTPDDFEAIRSREKPVIVKVGAEWCLPCKALDPALEKAVAEHGSGLELFHLDADDSDEIMEEFNVSAIPHVMAMKKGKVIDHFVGVPKQEDALKVFVERARNA